ncbi:hypothetical protein [Vibrio sp. vnigr-6D03]|uniref:hypothetical protein n=1 Tax=Vibrio sp. vnigr-6D03 TaxID=2058088 RepID=UPI00191C8C9C|nr:hypothetical protein [Vibrio sp. vnigr-6D03]
MNIHISGLGGETNILGSGTFSYWLASGSVYPIISKSKNGIVCPLNSRSKWDGINDIWLNLGLVISRKKWLRVSYYSSIGGMYLIWLAITLAAVLGASKALPIAGKGFSSTPIGEVAAELMVYAGSGLCVLSAALIVVGLYRGLKNLGT